MTNRTIESFFESEYIQQAQNANYSKIASYVDGLKPTSRKAVHIMNVDNITNWVKVENFSSLVSIKTEYLGGANNIGGVVVNTARNYIGSNNLVFFDKKGDFGARLNKSASAHRYIFTRKAQNFDTLFNKDDYNVLIPQEFEGSLIEPRFYMPVLPLIVINGNEGLGNGHSQKILPRDVNNVKKYITNVLNNKKNQKKLLFPSYNGFTGTVDQGEDNSKWVFTGRVERMTLNRYKIVELPLNHTMISYTKVLEKLLADKKIKSYKDLSNTQTDTFEFIVQFDPPVFKKLTDESAINLLKLEKKESENYTCIDENNAVVRFGSIEEVIDAYIKIRLEYYKKRKDYKISIMEENLNEQASRYKFIYRIVVDESLHVNNKSKSDIINQLETFSDFVKRNDSYDYLLNMPIYNLTSERLEKLKDHIINLKAELNEFKKMEIKDMWINDFKKL